MSQPDMTHHFTQTAHNQSYPGISPTLPSLSHHGKTVLITGGSQGIGLAVASAFAIAGAAHVIIVARSRNNLDEAKESLQTLNPTTSIHTFAVDLTNNAAITTLLANVRADIADPDILVLNAAHAGMPGPTLENTPKSLSADFEINVIANMTFMTQYLHEATLNKPKVVLNVSTAAANQAIPNLASYGASKLAFLFMCMHMQTELSKKDVRIMNYHPGAIFTNAAKKVGLNESSIPWDDANLPGHFAVWLASKEAAFLAGRLVYATWDVDELKARAAEIVDNDLLKIGLRGDAVELPIEEQAKITGANDAIWSPFGKQ
jgi:short-subunit dehydrogenase